MKLIKKIIFTCLCCLILFTCKSDDDSSFGSGPFAIIGDWVRESLILTEEGEASIDVTPPCLYKLSFTELTYQEIIQQGLNCEQEVISNIYDYEIVNDLLRVMDGDGEVMHEFGFEAVNSNTMKLTLDSVNGSDALGLIATYRFE